jgi:hypothetical protein
LAEMSDESELAELELVLEVSAGLALVACGRAVAGLSACSALECCRIAESTDMVLRLSAARRCYTENQAITEMRLPLDLPSVSAARLEAGKDELDGRAWLFPSPACEIGLEPVRVPLCVGLTMCEFVSELPLELCCEEDWDPDSVPEPDCAFLKDPPFSCSATVTVPTAGWRSAR